MRGTLELKDNRLCVRYEWPMSNEPTLVTIHWSVQRLVSTGYGQAPKEGDSLQSINSGIWAASDATNLRATGQVVIDPKVQAVHYEKTIIKCPKVRKGTETRYRDGAWEKLMKRGWVRA